MGSNALQKMMIMLNSMDYGRLILVPTYNYNSYNNVVAKIYMLTSV